MKVDAINVICDWNLVYSTILFEVYRIEWLGKIYGSVLRKYYTICL